MVYSSAFSVADLTSSAEIFAHHVVTGGLDETQSALVEAQLEAHGLSEVASAIGSIRQQGAENSEERFFKLVDRDLFHIRKTLGGLQVGRPSLFAHHAKAILPPSRPHEEPARLILQIDTEGNVMAVAESPKYFAGGTTSSGAVGVATPFFADSEVAIFGEDWITDILPDVLRASGVYGATPFELAVKVLNKPTIEWIALSLQVIALRILGEVIHYPKNLEEYLQGLEALASKARYSGWPELKEMARVVVRQAPGGFPHIVNFLDYFEHHQSSGIRHLARTDQSVSHADMVAHESRIRNLATILIPFRSERFLDGSFFAPGADLSSWHGEFPPWHTVLGHLLFRAELRVSSRFDERIERARLIFGNQLEEPRWKRGLALAYYAYLILPFKKNDLTREEAESALATLKTLLTSPDEVLREMAVALYVRILYNQFDASRKQQPRNQNLHDQMAYIRSDKDWEDIPNFRAALLWARQQALHLQAVAEKKASEFLAMIKVQEDGLTERETMVFMEKWGQVGRWNRWRWGGAIERILATKNFVVIDFLNEFVGRFADNDERLAGLIETLDKLLKMDPELRLEFADISSDDWREHFKGRYSTGFLEDLSPGDTFAYEIISPIPRWMFCMVVVGKPKSPIKSIRHTRSAFV